jgi:hypothetical protein
MGRHQASIGNHTQLNFIFVLLPAESGWQKCQTILELI